MIILKIIVIVVVILIGLAAGRLLVDLGHYFEEWDAMQDDWY